MCCVNCFVNLLSRSHFRSDLRPQLQCVCLLLFPLLYLFFLYPLNLHCLSIVDTLNYGADTELWWIKVSYHCEARTCQADGDVISERSSELVTRSTLIPAFSRYVCRRLYHQHTGLRRTNLSHRNAISLLYLNALFHPNVPGKERAVFE